MVVVNGAYGIEYFELGLTSNYYGYKWLPELVFPRVQAVVEHLNLRAPNRILDYGCAKGYYVKAFRELGYLAEGIEVSSYALSQAPNEIKQYLHFLAAMSLTSIPPKAFDLSLAKDVLEHLHMEELQSTLNELRRISRQVLITVPITDEHGDYVNEADRVDQTHRIRCTRDEWIVLLDAVECDHQLCRALKGKNAIGTLCALVST